jgi:intracellular sulfur oxidation DsrE/DsrF family protein
MNIDDPSDERLNAWIDGELGADEAAPLLARMRVDATLRERVAELRLLKTLVRHAYADTLPPDRARPPSVAPQRLRRAAAGMALLVAGVAVGWLIRPAGDDGAAIHTATAGGDRAADAAATHAAVTHIVLHVGAPGAAAGLATLDRAEGIFEAARAAGRPVALEIVANGGGIDLLRRDTSAHTARIDAMRRAYPELSMVACGQTVQRLHDAGVEVQLLPGTVTATSALDQIVLRMQQGWSYVRI